MTITQLEYIIAVDTHRNFAEAARRCFITQPTLSMQIKKLEDELDVLIFDRSKKPVIPTEVGQKIIEQARDGLKRLEKINDIIAEEQEELIGELRVGIIPTLSPYLLPRFATRFTSQYPGVSLIVEEMLSDQIARKLQHDLLDIGILVTPLDATSIRELPLFYEGFFVYHSPDHPLGEVREVKTSELDFSQMWLLREGHCFRSQMVNVCGGEHAAGTARPMRFESGSIETLKKLVDRQYGFTLMPELAVMELDPEERKQIRPLVDPLPLREVSLVTHRSFLKQRLIEAFREEVLAGVPKELQIKERGRIVRWKE